MYTNVNEPYGALITAVAAPSIVLAVGVIVIGVAGAARPNPSLIVNSWPSTPAGNVTATATGPGTAISMILSVADTTVTGVATAVLISTNAPLLALIVIIFAPVPVVGATVIPGPASIEVGLFVYDILIFLVILLVKFCLSLIRVGSINKLYYGTCCKVNVLVFTVNVPSTAVALAVTTSPTNNTTGPVDVT